MHADKMFAPGQLRVAISRVRSDNDIYVLGFRRDTCLRHSSVITDFDTRAQQAVLESGNCCRQHSGRFVILFASIQEPDI